MIYQAKIYTSATPDGPVTQFRGVVLVFADNYPMAHDKAKDHWGDFIKIAGGTYVIDIKPIDAEVIIP